MIRIEHFVISAKFDPQIYIVAGRWLVVFELRFEIKVRNLILIQISFGRFNNLAEWLFL